MGSPKESSTDSSGQGSGLGGNEKLINGGLVPAKTETTSQQSLNSTANPSDITPQPQSTDNTNTSPSSSDTSTGNTATTKGSDAPPNSTPVEQILKNNGVTFSNPQSTQPQLGNLNAVNNVFSGETPVIPSDNLISSQSWLANSSPLKNATYGPMLNDVNPFRDANTFNNFKSVAGGNEGGYFMNYYGTDKAVGIVSSYSTDLNNLYTGHNAVTGDLTFSSMAHNNMISVTDTNGSNLGSLLYNNQYTQPKVTLQGLDAGANNIMATTAGQTALDQQQKYLHAFSHSPETLTTQLFY